MIGPSEFLTQKHGSFGDEVVFEVCHFGILSLQVHMSGVSKGKEEIANLSLTHVFISSGWFK